MDVTTTAAHARGFTVIGMMITLVVLLLLTGIGIPTWRQMIDHASVSSTRNLVAGSIQLARQGAVTRIRPLTLCPSNDLQHCSRNYKAWHQGIILFEDSNANRRRDRDEPLLRVIQGIPPRVVIQSSRGRRSIRYSPDGSAWGSNLTLRLCLPGTPEANRAIILYGTGRIRFSRLLPDGKKITCLK